MVRPFEKEQALHTIRPLDEQSAHLGSAQESMARTRTRARVGGRTFGTFRLRSFASSRLLPVGLGLGLLELAELVEVGLVAEAHAEDRRRHARDQDRHMPSRVVGLGPGDGAEEEDAEDRGQIADAFPVRLVAGMTDRDAFVTHDAGTSLPAGWFRS